MASEDTALSSSLSPLAPSTTLSDDINTATRSLHMQLNRLITSRLPLCLPPHTGSRTLYATGLEHFAHIFLTFESLFHDLASQASVSNPALSALLQDPWVHIAASEKNTDPNSPASPTSPISEHGAEVQTLLASLLPAGLPRSRRLLADLAHLRKQHKADLSTSLAYFPGRTIQRICAHIRDQGTRKPHVLIAYAWCFYMAVFSGGRWIRGQLALAGEDFWTMSVPRPSTAVENEKENVADLQPSASPPTNLPGLSFWHFPTPTNDGLDIKSSFKSNLALFEPLLTSSERADIIAEAQHIFTFCFDLVAELDETCSTPSNLTVRLNTDSQELEKLARENLPSPAVGGLREDQRVGGKEMTAGELRMVTRQPRQQSRWLEMRNLVPAAVVLSCVSWLAIQQLECLADAKTWLEAF